MVTRAGVVLLAAAAVAVVAGVAAGYPELVALAAGWCVPVGVAVIGYRRAVPFTVTRIVSPPQVEVGQAAACHITIKNNGRHRTRRTHGLELVAGEDIAFEIPPLRPGESSPERTLVMPTSRRGIHTIGPLRVGRPDPFGLVAGAEQDPSTAAIVVHPRVHPLRPQGTGATRDLDGPTSDLAREGGIAFHGLRSYVPGDDVRLIHWRAVARTGTGELVVRQHVETIRPDVALLIDANPDDYEGGGFELAMEIAASVVCCSLTAGRPVSLLVSAARAESPSSGSTMLDSALLTLAGLEPTATVPLADAVSAIQSIEGQSLMIVTGSVSDEEVLGLTDYAARFARVLVLRADPNAEAPAVSSLGRVVVATAPDGPRFVQLWNEQLV